MIFSRLSNFCLFIYSFISGDITEFQWSSNISIINDNEQFVRIPYYGDIRLTIINSACTTFLIIDSVSQVSHNADISATFFLTKSIFM